MLNAVARFRADVAALTGAECGDLRFGVAVSGGPDSMALLWLAARAYPGHLAAATVDHRLRPEAGAEAAMVRDWCSSQGIPHAVLTPATPITGSVQAGARAARYALLGAWRAEQGIDHIFTAHHADDQLETVAMRLNRGSGVAGLAGVRARNGQVLRPLLGWRRQELADICAAAALPVVDDPSNHDVDFDRVRLRRQIAAAPWLDAAAVARSARHLAAADQALDWAAHQLIAAWPDHGDASIIRDAACPPELFRRIVLIRLAGHAGARPLKGSELDRVVSGMISGKRVSTGRLLVTPQPPGNHGRCWRISDAVGGAPQAVGDMRI